MYRGKKQKSERGGWKRQYDTSIAVSHELPTFILLFPAHNSKTCTTASTSFHDNWSLLDFRTETTCQSSALLIRQCLIAQKKATNAISPLSGTSKMHLPIENRITVHMSVHGKLTHSHNFFSFVKIDVLIDKKIVTFSH